MWQIYKRHYRWAAVPGSLFLFVFITGSSPLAGYLVAGLEAPYARTNWDDLPEADTVVVLGELPPVQNMRSPGWISAHERIGS